MKKIFYLLVVFVANASNLYYSQEQCVTDTINQSMLKKNPSMQLLIDELEKETQQYNTMNTVGKSSLVTFSIPIVVHVLHDYGAENISDAQIISAINQLNLDFSGSNADLVNVIPQFTATIGTPSLVFVPARLDPMGNCTNGIDRIADEQTYNGYSKTNQWPPSKYLNFWVVNNILGGAAGFASPPTQPMADQGIVVQYTAFDNTSRTPTHEMGHFFNLEHTFQGGCQSQSSCGSNGDNVCDTPPTTSNPGCPSPTNAVNCFGMLSNYQNFMDYSNCRIMFTQGQLTRMWAALSSTIGARSSLITNSTAIATGITLPLVVCAPKIDFKPGYKKFICAGDSVRYEDLSYSNAASTRTWSFAGGTPSSSSLSVVWVKYNSPGVFSTTLTGANTGGISIGFKNDIVSVLPISATYSNSFNEGFESVASYTANWENLSKANNTWSITGLAAYTGSSCSYIQNKTSKNNETDILYSPTFNLANSVAPKLSFARSYARIDGSNDKLNILASKDCGKNWITIYSKFGAQLATTFSTSVNFIPTSPAEWALDTIDLSLIANETNVRFAFEIINDNGNNIFLDDINLYSNVITKSNNLGINIPSFNIYPNPSNGSFNLIVSEVASKTIKLSVYNIMGEMVHTSINDNVNQKINLTSLQNGIYFVNISNDTQSSTKRLIINK
ncbi:MAG: M43 family zinc metalloprotease [Bacteroidota bacterium]|nr:M43 family zinc metalloprotease [Bacteroidota bacterium]